MSSAIHFIVLITKIKLSINYWKLYQVISWLDDTVIPEGSWEIIKQYKKEPFKLPKKLIDSVYTIDYDLIIDLDVPNEISVRKKFNDILKNTSGVDTQKLYNNNDNLLFLVLFLYDYFWDKKKVGFDSSRTISFEDMNERDRPISYLNDITGLELAKFLCYYHNIEDVSYTDKGLAITPITVDAEPALSVKISKRSSGGIKNKKLSSFMFNAIVEAILNSPSNDTLGSNFSLIKEQMRKKDHSDFDKYKYYSLLIYLSKIKDESPFPRRNEAIASICLCLHAFIKQCKIFFNSKNQFESDELSLYSNILNFLGIKYDEHERNSPESINNLRTILRDYINKVQKPKRGKKER